MHSIKESDDGDDRNLKSVIVMLIIAPDIDSNIDSSIVPCNQVSLLWQTQSASFILVMIMS